LTLLTVDYLGRELVTLSPGSPEFYLDRSFLSVGDNTLSRRPYAPCLRLRDDEWWLDNDCRDDVKPLAVLADELGWRCNVPSQCSFRLRSGENELHIWRPEFRVLLMVTSPVTVGVRYVPQSPSGIEPGTTTVVGLDNATQRVIRLFQQKPRYKMIIVAHYREYLTPGINRPRELSRTETANCFGGNQDNVSEAKKAIMDAIWGEQGHGDEIAEWLVRRRLISRADQSLVPHRDCAHSRPRKG
jgi:hypothetical protein